MHRLIVSFIAALALVGLFQPMTPTLAADPVGPVKDVELINQKGENFTLHSLKGNYVLISFLYTKCPMPNICPLNMQLNKRVIDEWKAMPRHKNFPLKVLAVTLDPANDNPAALMKFGDGYKVDWENITLATGDPQKLDDFASQFNAVGFPAPDGTISHSMRTVLLNPLMIPIAEYKDNAWAPHDILAQIRTSIAWWKWFFIISAALAIPSLVILIYTKKIFAKASSA